MIYLPRLSKSDQDGSDPKSHSKSFNFIIMDINAKIDLNL